MEQLHTSEEIKYFDDMNECANELIALSKKYKQSACADLAADYKERVASELAKYNHLIGSTVKGKRNYGDKSPFVGTIRNISHFNAYSDSVRVGVTYSSGGFDGFGLKNLTLIDM